jgi:hypothetical protein
MALKLNEPGIEMNRGARRYEDLFLLYWTSGGSLNTTHRPAVIGWDDG